MSRDMKQDTKQKIALAIRQLMQERPLRKITVQDLMERTQMTRQSFYYHFQDIQDVLAWIGEQQIVDHLQDTKKYSFEDWMMQVFILLDGDRNFYRQVFNSGHPTFLRRFGNKLLRRRMIQLLFHTEEEAKLNEQQQFVVDFAIQAVMVHLNTFLSSRRPLDQGEVRARLRFLLKTLSLNGAEN